MGKWGKYGGEEGGGYFLLCFLSLPAPALDSSTKGVGFLRIRRVEFTDLSGLCAASLPRAFYKAVLVYFIKTLARYSSRFHLFRRLALFLFFFLVLRCFAFYEGEWAREEKGKKREKEGKEKE